MISIYLASALVVKGRLLLTNSMLKLGLKNPPFHLPKNFIEFNCSRNIAYSDELVSFEKAMYQDAFLTVEFRTNLALCNQSKKG